MSSYACGGVDKLMEFFVVLIISEIDPSLIEQLVLKFSKTCATIDFSCQNEIKSQTSFW